MSYESFLQAKRHLGDRHGFKPTFMGVGSEVYGAVLNGRRAIGAELKASYYRQAIKNLESIKQDEENVELNLAST